jgi:hypothetical protein
MATRLHVLNSISNGINPAGTTVGVYVDASNVIHGFVRDPNGAITPFDAPGANQGTWGYNINPAGAIVSDSA